MYDILNNKILHTDPAVVTSVIEMIESKFGKMTVTRGTKHIFLGMDIEFMPNGTVTISMPSYICKAINKSGMSITGSGNTPVDKFFFEIDIESVWLMGEKVDAFHSVVAKLLYVSKT